MILGSFGTFNSCKGDKLSKTQKDLPRYDDIYFPSKYTYGKLFLIGPKFEYTFNKKLFWNTFIQYSSRSDNLGVNSRLQWRFAPLSDFYLVYNDNYFTYNNLVPRVRSLTFKLTYWLNI